MEISPISVVRIAPVIRSKQNDLGLTDIFEIERSSRSDDETYTPGGNKAASGFEDDEDQAEEQEETADEANPEEAADSSGEPGALNYFA